MYISGQRETGRRRSGDIKIPEKYAGTAFSDAKGAYETDTEALMKAEEAFRRGYVFEEMKPQAGDASENSADVPSVTSSAEGALPASSAEPEPSSQAAHEAVPVSVHKNVLPQRRGGLSGILDRLTSENIILIALILVLWDSKADDELLLMLVILFLC